MDAQKELKKTFYKAMVLIRAFEEKVTALAQEGGRLPGMQILATGQEAVAAGVVAAMGLGDVMVTNHRSHGHLLAKGADPSLLMAEMMGKKTGVNQGKSGTLHMAVPEINALMTSTVVGASPPLAVGAAFAQHYRNEPNITVVFFGDGAAAEGSVHEAMNLAGVWKLPVLFVCENNCWAGAQDLCQHCATENIAGRAGSYNMPGESVDGNDVEAVHALALRLADHCRTGKGPALIEALTYRMRGHGEYDRQHYVDKEELDQWSKRCPIKGFREKLLAGGLLSESEAEALEQEAGSRVDAAVRFADESPYPRPGEALKHVWAEI